MKCKEDKKLSWKRFCCSFAFTLETPTTAAFRLSASTLQLHELTSSSMSSPVLQGGAPAVPAQPRRTPWSSGGAGDQWGDWIPPLHWWVTALFRVYYWSAASTVVVVVVVVYKSLLMFLLPWKVFFCFPLDWNVVVALVVRYCCLVRSSLWYVSLWRKWIFKKWMDENGLIWPSLPPDTRRQTERQQVFPTCQNLSDTSRCTQVTRRESSEEDGSYCPIMWKYQ